MKITAAAIDFGTSKIVTLVGTGNGIVPADLAGAGNIAYEGYLDGEWNAPDDVVIESMRRSIQQAQSNANTKIEEIFAGVPGGYIRVETNEVEMELSSSGRKVTVDDIDRIVADAMGGSVQNEQVIHRNPAWFSVDDKRTMEPVGVKGHTLRCMVAFILADERFMKDVRGKCAALNIAVKEFASSSLGGALMLISPEERDKQAVLVDVGYLATEVMVVQGDALIYHEVLPVGGGHVTADLAYGLRCPMAVAEQVKRKFVMGSMPMKPIDATDAQGESISFIPNDVRDIAEPRVEEIAEMIKDSLNRSHCDLSPRSTVYLTGGGIAMIRGSKEFLSSELDRTVKAPLPLAAKLNSPIYSSSLGLLELVYESIATPDEMDGEGGGLKKLGSALKAFFTK